jgi:competence protein ComEC
MCGRPVLAVALAFVGGVALGAWLPQEPAAWGWAAAAALVIWGALLAARRLEAGRRVALAAFVAAGIFRAQGDLAPLYAGGDALDEGPAVASGRIARPAESREGQTILQLAGARVRRNGATRRFELPLQVVVPDGGGTWALGDLVTARGQLRALRGDRNLGWFPGPVTARGARCAARLVVSSTAWIRRDGYDPGRGPGAAVLRWRAAADQYWKGRPGAAGQILNSLTTGERAGIPAGVQAAFLRSGLTHLLAISGMNVGFLAALAFLLLRRGVSLLEPLALRVPAQPVAALLTLPTLWFFMLFSGSQIPVGRAVISCAAGLVAVLLWRRVDAADAWALAGLALVAADPRSLFGASFQLSFAAVGALLLVAPRLAQVPPADPLPGERRLSELWRGVRSLFVVSLAATTLTAPLVAFHFQQVSLVGPLANLIAVPFTGFVVLPAGWLALAAAALWSPAGALVGAAALWSAQRLIEIAAWFAAPGWAIVSTARPPLLLTLLLLGLAGALLARPTRRLQFWSVGLCAAAALAGCAWAIAAHRRQLTVAVLDVGQGLAAAVLLPGGGSLLYDAGPRWRDYDAGERVVVPALRRLGVTRLDTLAISHRHPDHDGGAAAVRRNLPVGAEWRGEGAGALLQGEQRPLGGAARALVLNPAAVARGRPGEQEQNDRSLAIAISWGATGVVLSGDVGPSVAERLAAAAPRLPAHLALQAPHHGGSPAACSSLAAAMRPEVSVISVGRNTYGHPRAGAIAALASSGRVLRTDRDGAVFISSDGRALAVRTWRERACSRTWPERLRWLLAGW